MSVVERGFSLLEALLAGVLSLLLLTIFSWILVPLGKGTATTSKRAELQQLASTAVDRMTQTLLQSSAAGTSVRNDPNQPQPTVMAIQGLEDLSAGGTPIWSDRLTVFAWDKSTRVLSQGEWPPTPPDLGWLPDPTRAVRLSPAELGALGSSNPKRTLLASSVEDFQVLGFSQEGIFTPPLELRLFLKHDDQHQYELQHVVHFRNAARSSSPRQP